MIDLTKERPLSIEQAAKLFRVHRRTVEGWFSRGLDRVKLGGRVFTSREALNRFAIDDATPDDDLDTAEAFRVLEDRFGV